MWVIVYGSLMNKEQFQGKKFRLVTVKGWKRIFNKVVSRAVWKPYTNGNVIGTLNIIPESKASFNAIAFYVTNEEFASLIEREEDYRNVTAEMFDFKTGSPLDTGTLFVANENNKSGENIIRDDILPIPKYLTVCREGAYSWQPGFGEVFDETTFIADGKTTVKEFLDAQ